MRDVTEEWGVVEEIEFLARSPIRVQLLQALNENGGVEKRTLKAEIDGSRTTLTRNLEAVADRGWIRSDNQTYSITPTGRAVVEDLLDVMETVDIAIRFKEFFERVPAAEFDLDLRHLADAELLVAKPGDPYAMINRHVQLLKSMDRCRSLLPVTGMHAAEAAHERILNSDARAEVVAVPAVADVIRSNPNYAPLFEELRATGRVAVYVYEGEFPYSINVIDETVQLVVADGNEPRALLETDSEEVVEWAERTYEAYKREATPVFEN